MLNARQRLDSQTVRADKARISLAILTSGSLPPQAGLQPRLTDGVDLDFAGPVDINQGEQAGMLAEIAASNPELRKLEAELARARERIAQERGAILPSAQLRWTQSQDPDVRSTQAGISISLPLFDRRSGPIEEAVAEASRLRIVLESRQAELVQEARLAVQALKLASRRVAALDTGVVRQAGAALSIAETAYQFGERGLLEVLDAQRVLRTAQTELLQARYELQLAAIELDRLRGRYASQFLSSGR
ncbi:MAG: TolC family protein [Candidatus Protistobacter heckmanni]|nr:TolC family protein [Candidatus Protistobacter heckmanni]